MQKKSQCRRIIIRTLLLLALRFKISLKELGWGLGWSIVTFTRSMNAAGNSLVTTLIKDIVINEKRLIVAG